MDPNAPWGGLQLTMRKALIKIREATRSRGERLVYYWLAGMGW
jgi:hypothetical protein